MQLKKLILGTSALIGVGLLGTSAATSVSAAEVKPGGALDITITGFARFEAGGGEQNDLNLDNTFARGLDFRNDTEVHVLAKGKSEQTGLEYGGTIEFEADTDSTFNTDESWIFLRGGWGEVRLGDEDGAVDNSILGGQTVAAGTGGIDGSSFVVANIAGEGVFPTETSDATKIRYYTPSFGGFSVGVSFTPTVTNLNSGSNNGQFIARKNGDNAMDAENTVEGALVYDGDFGGVGFKASVVGLYGKLTNGAAESIADGGQGGDSYWNTTGGVVLDLFGFKLGGSVGTDNVGDLDHQFMTAGVGYGFGPVNLSVTYAYIFDSNNDFSEAKGYDKPYNLVFSADYALAPGLVLAGDVSTFNLDTNSNYTGDTGDSGWAAVGSVRLAF
jgi:outer membrane protein OmpU